MKVYSVGFDLYLKHPKSCFRCEHFGKWTSYMGMRPEDQLLIIGGNSFCRLHQIVIGQSEFGCSTWTKAKPETMARREAKHARLLPRSYKRAQPEPADSPAGSPPGQPDGAD